ncbi:MAG TPA: CHAT domain-containing tetratricopeptide repeat protein [Mycobacteriales bacterium]|nr:CHAT domain-containing tetratricopeptide repeat protein [Mycobacteriales bacterium]
MSRQAAESLADEALALVGTSPRRAQRVALQAIRLSIQEGDVAAEVRALRAHGMAARDLGRLDEAMASLRRAIRRAGRHGAAAAAAEARMSLAYVLMETGATRAALSQADRAAQGLDGLPAARVLMQRGLILQRSGRTAEALDCYRRALPVVRRRSDHLHEARLRNNRGLLHLYCGDLTAAEADLTRAEALFDRLGQDILTADARWNLAFVAARRGDVPTALRLYDSTEAIYRRHGVPAPELLLTRGELLLSVGLTGEARDTAGRAVRELEAAGNRSLLPEALVLLAQAALADDNTDAAREAARRAMRMFVGQRRVGWATVARYVALRADERAGALTRGLRARALRVAADLARMGWRTQELDARIVAVRVALAHGQVDTVRRELAELDPARRRGPTELRIRAWYAEALLRMATGDQRGAQRAVRAGLRVLDRQRATLGATELRVHVSGHGSELATLGLVLARSSDSAHRMLDWAERWRAGALRLRPVRPPDEPTLADALAELRRVSSQAEEALLGEGASRGGGSPARLLRQKASLEERVRRLVRRSPGSGLLSGTPEPPTVRQLAEHLGDRVLVELVEHDGTLLAVTVRDGTAKLHELGRPELVRRSLESMRFALRRLAFEHGSPESLNSARATISRSAERIDTELLGPLRPVLTDRRLVLVPTGALQALPWALLPSCASRPVSVVPSAAVWLRGARAAPARPVTDTGKVLLVCGPGLDGAAAEIDALAGRYPGTEPLTGPRATVEAALSGLDGAEVAHIAAHGRVRSDNPLFSALDLADGPLTVYDLERLAHAPRLVLLPACQSGVSSVLAGDEVMGLTSALFALGTRTIFATVIPVPDAATHPLMVALHDALRQGISPADALVYAQTKADPYDPSALATVAGFVCYGVG